MGAFAPLTEEQFNSAVSSGFSPDEVIQHEQTRKAESEHPAGSAVPESVKNAPQSSNSDLIAGGLSKLPGKVAEYGKNLLTKFGPGQNEAPDSSGLNPGDSEATMAGMVGPISTWNSVKKTFAHPIQSFSEDPVNTAQTLTLPAQLAHPIDATEGMNKVGAVAKGAAKGAFKEAMQPAQMNVPFAGKVNVPKIIKSGTIGAEIGGAGQYLGYIPGGAEAGALAGAAYPILKGGIKGGISAYKNLGKKVAPKIAPETSVSHEFVGPKELSTSNTIYQEPSYNSKQITDGSQKELGSEFHGHEKVPEDPQPKDPNLSVDKPYENQEPEISGKDFNYSKDKSSEFEKQNQKEDPGEEIYSVPSSKGDFKVYKKGNGYYYTAPNKTELAHFYSLESAKKVANDIAKMYPKESELSESELPKKENEYPDIKQEKSTPEEESIISFYKGNGYTAIHSKLRKGLPHPYTKELDSAINKGSLQQDTVLHRGVAGSYADHLSELNEGDSFTNLGYSSATWKPSIKDNFSNSGVELNINLKKGQKAFSFGPHDGEGEILLPRGMKYKILDKKQISGKTILDVEPE
jgi:hypothetical protein